MPQKPAYATSIFKTWREIEATIGSGEEMSIQEEVWQMSCLAAELGVRGVSTASKGGMIGAGRFERDWSFKTAVMWSERRLRTRAWKWSLVTGDVM